MDSIAGRQTPLADSCWKVGAFRSWRTRYFGWGDETEPRAAVKRQMIFTFSVCIMRFPLSYWYPDSIISNFLCVLPDEAVRCEEEIRSGVNRKEGRGRGLSSLQPLYCLASSLVLPVSHCASSLHVHILENCLPSCLSLSLSLQKIQPRASSISISMAADNHLIQLAEAALWGQDRSHWPTYEMSMSTVNYIGFNCWHTVVDIII